MKIKLLLSLLTAFTVCLPKINFGQAPVLGTSADFVLYTTVGAITNTGITHLTGNVGSNSGSSTGFGNVDGGMYDGGPQSAQAAVDLLSAQGDLVAAVPTFFPLPPSIGGGVTFGPGVYSMPFPVVLDLELILDGQGDPNALFIFQIGGAFSTNTNSKITLINGAKACNVFWGISGLTDMAAGTTMRGTIIADNAAINMGSGCTLEGRVLALNGAISVNGILGYTPIGCGSPILTGPVAPNLVSAGCFALFSGIGPVTNSGSSFITGDIGTNSGLTTGFNPLFVTGSIHPIPDGATAACATDLLNAYTYVNTLPYDIELLYPAQFGNSLVLTPHTYLMNGAVTFIDTLFLNAQGDANAVFVIQINGALSTSTFSNVVLRNGAQSKNVYWKVDGAVDINDYSTFRGTIICNNGAMNLNTGVLLDGRALTTTGALSTMAITTTIPSGCSPITITEPTSQIACEGASVSFSVVASGVGLNYQWRKGSVDLVDGGIISGATTPTLTLNPITILDSSTVYNVVITGSHAPNDTSNFIGLTVNTAPQITTEPISQTVCEGATVTFTTVTTGAGLTYQWRKGTTNLVNSLLISGATTNTLTLNSVTVSDVALDYNLVVSGTCSSNDVSTFVELTVNTAPQITTEPISQTVCEGATVTFTTVSTGTNLTYQWRKGNLNLLNVGNIAGVTTNTLTISSVSQVDAVSNYNLVVSGTCSPTATSIDAFIVVNSIVTITTQPINSTHCEGENISFSTVATGTGLTYQWRKGNVNLVNSASVIGVTTNSLTFNNLTSMDAGTDYNVVISGTCAPSVTSNNVILTVNALPIANAVSNSPICKGDSIVFTASSVLGGTYSWSGQSGYSSTSKDSTILVSTLLNSGDYSLIVTANGCVSAPSLITVVVNDCSADLSILKSVSNVTPMKEHEVIFTIIAHNNGLITASGVTVSESIQDGYTFVSATSTFGSYNSSTGIWTIGEMKNGDTETLTIIVKVNRNGNYTNTVVINGNELDINLTNNTATIETIPKDINLTNNSTAIQTIPTDFFIPEGFSPNGDGINDMYEIRGILPYTNNSFDVFNRWGEKVFEANPYTNTWDGRTNSGFRIGGDELPVGTYFYVLDLGDGSKVYKGTIYLNR